MLFRLATQKRRLKPKVQEIADDDILDVSSESPRPKSASEVDALLSGEHRVVASRSRIAAFPSYAHDEPTIPFLGRIDSWKLPPPPRLPRLRSFLSRPPSTSSSDSSVPPVALPATTIPTPRAATRKAATVTSASATQKIRAALGDATENTLLIVQGRPSIAWAVGLLAIGTCFGALLARPGRSESPAAQIAQESVVTMTIAPTRAPTVSEVAVPIVITPAAVTPVAITPVPAPAANVPKTAAAHLAKPHGKKAAKGVTSVDALAQEQLKSALR
jgi:hypothetical protein